MRLMCVGQDLYAKLFLFYFFSHATLMLNFLTGIWRLKPVSRKGPPSVVIHLWCQAAGQSTSAGTGHLQNETSYTLTSTSNSQLTLTRGSTFVLASAVSHSAVGLRCSVAQVQTGCGPYSSL